MKRSRKSLYAFTAMTLSLGLFSTGVFLPMHTYANTYTVPKLLITEVTPDSLQVDGTTGTPDAFEFVELYNSTDSTINLKNCRILYETPTVYTWTITTDKYIPAKGTFVVWIKSDSTATLADFNANYGTSLTSGQVFEVSASGMANTAGRTLSIAGSDNLKISTVSYTPEDVGENIGIPYLYPTDGTNKMRKLTTDKRRATPGSVFTGQVPPTAWDNIDPAAPTGLAATPGSGQVTLSWNANSEADLAFYRVYVDGVFYHTYRKETRSVTVTGLNPEQDYAFEVAAVDTSNNASVKTAIGSAPLSVTITQSSVVGTPTGSFPQYNDFFSRATVGPIIPGLASGQDLVPQGIAYEPTKNWLLVSHYRDGASSMLTAIDAATGKLVKSMTIYHSSGTPYTGHAGGVAVTPTDVWIASGDYLRRIPLQEVINVKNRDRVYIADQFKTVTNASFVTYANGILWAGEFYASPNYLTDSTHYTTTRTGTSHHSWMAGYKLDRTASGTTARTPDYILSIADKVQGAAVLADGRFALSSSYGRTNDSKLWIYENVLAQTPHYYSTVNGTSVPSWQLDAVSIDSTVVAPPMTEGIVEKGGTLYTLFESAATEYRSTSSYPIDNIMKLNLSGL